MSKILNKTEKGFTLIELMVSVSLFTVVVMISMGAIFTVVDANKKAQTLKTVMNNLNFALETMTRTIKTGTMGNVTNSTISIVDQDGKTVIYSYIQGVGAVNGKIEKCTDSAAGCGKYITAPEVNIKNLKFIKAGGTQPMVVMVVQGTAKLSEKISSDFNIQTAITQRLPAN